jgi:gliding motility-associated lipoprotein GldD
MTKFFYLFLFTIIFSCGDHVVPKPNAYLRLEYPKAKYVEAQGEAPFSFEVNELAKNITAKPIESTTESYAVTVEYPTLKGTIFLTYKSIDNNPDNLMAFLRDAQKFTTEHMIKADEIPVYPYENNEKKVYGMFSELKGDVASPAQFYVTDSINHFLTGSLYFYAKPNYDSILPAANYLGKDIKHIMETVKWKE